VRILHVVRGLANSSGTTHIVGPLAEAQARQGHCVRVFYVDKPGQPPVLPDPALVRSSGFPMTVRSTHFGWSIPFAKAIRRAVLDTDVVHIHAIWNFPTWCAMRAAHRAGVPYVVAPQGSLEAWALNRHRLHKEIYATLTEQRYFNTASAMQALTATEAEQCRQFGITAPARILPNGVDLGVVDRQARAVNVRTQLGLPADSVLVLFLGRLFPKKGLDLLIPAFARLAADRRDVFLLVAGHDAGSGYREVLEQLTREHGIADRARFLGEVAGRQKFALLTSTDVFALTSYSEGLPIAVLEAMACRRPVVVTPNCNIPEVAANAAGWVVTPSIEGVYEGLRTAVDSALDRATRGHNARRTVESKFTWERIARESLNLYKTA
jgi:glycosyltransferase involved in cell wall biosynthesis